ncbi:MAG: cupin domain-containing protein [Ancalomicrobiaceae bacterium]|nr:cupin domain-containing protein [Ancalomicrobiaceae bacterium]
MADGGVSAKPTCVVMKAASPFVGKQGFTYSPAISAEMVGSHGIHMQLVTIPPGAVAKAHLHENHETAIYILSGDSAMNYGDNLELYMEARAGDYVYIPASMPHRPYNLSDTEPCLAIIARTDPNEQESVQLLPHLDSVPK